MTEFDSNSLTGGGMRYVYVTVFIGLICLFLSGCGSLNSAVQKSHVSTNTITDMQVNMKVGDKLTSNCSVTRILGIPFGDFSWFSNSLAENVSYDTNMRRDETTITPITSSPFASAIDFIMGVLGFNGVTDIKECEKVAAYKLVTSEGIDVIYAPRYISDSTGFPILYRRTTVTLTGYKGTITGFKQLDSQDLSR